LPGAFAASQLPGMATAAPRSAPPQVVLLRASLLATPVVAANRGGLPVSRFASLCFFIAFCTTSVRAEVAAPLDYLDALQAILDRSTEIGSEKANLEALKAKNLPSHLALLPTVSLEARDGVDQNQGLTFDPVLGFTTESVRTDRYGVGATGALNLFRFGGDLA